MELQEEDGTNRTNERTKQINKQATTAQVIHNDKQHIHIVLAHFGEEKKFISIQYLYSYFVFDYTH